MPLFSGSRDDHYEEPSPNTPRHPPKEPISIKEFIVKSFGLLIFIESLVCLIVGPVMILQSLSDIYIHNWTVGHVYLKLISGSLLQILSLFEMYVILRVYYWVL